MGMIKQLLEELHYEDLLGEENRAYYHYMEEDQYNRYPVKPTEKE